MANAHAVGHVQQSDIPRTWDSRGKNTSTKGITKGMSGSYIIFGKRQYTGRIKLRTLETLVLLHVYNILAGLNFALLRR